MEHNNQTPQSQKNMGAHTKTVHYVLAKSYFLFFVAVLVGMFLDVLYPLQISANNPPVLLGGVMILLGTFVIAWAQKTSRAGATERKDNTETLTHEHFLQGPYKYLRSPTHAGLTLLVVGYGLLSNELFVVLTTIVFAVISRVVYVARQEKMLEDKYGDSYKEYKSKVKM